MANELSVILLKHTQRYQTIEGAYLRFYAEVKQTWFGPKALGVFEYEDGRRKTVEVLPLTGELKYSEPFEFKVEWRGNAWYASLRPMFV